MSMSIDLSIISSLDIYTIFCNKQYHQTLSNDLFTIYFANLHSTGPTIHAAEFLPLKRTSRISFKLYVLLTNPMPIET